MPKEFTEEFEPLLIKDFSGEKQPKLPNRSLVLAACAACIGGTFQFGYNISVINAPTTDVHNFINQTWIERYQTGIPENVLTLLWSTIVSIFTIGGLLGVTVGGTLSMKLGRKGTLLANNAFAIIAALLMGLSYPTGYFELLIIGRFISGLNAGIGLCVQPLYLGEIAPTAFRGAMGMGTSISITLGLLAGQVVGLKELLGKEDSWPILLATTCVPAFLQLLILPWFPESPRYLLIDRRDSEGCKKALTQLHGVSRCDGELEDIEKEKRGLADFKAKKPWELLCDRSVRLQLLTVVLLNVAQQLNGINAGILIDRLGRKVLIMGGYTLMSICCILFTLTLSYQSASPIVPYLSIASVFAFILSFGLGPGGVTNILTTELFTQATRPAAYIIAGSLNWLSFFFISMVFPFLVVWLEQYCFLVFMAVCTCMAIYIFFVVPETKNKTFVEIQNEFKSSKKARTVDAAGMTQLLSI
ncbi:Solute carrier family 2 facilitated glucose transporter member 11 [Dissostichus eleginoides]|uniref:Solute carrier family 2, facilitated glucose transporter member 5 n=1 Tax=Dissostichus eleginoides TaxID=100907 RepID=A0AAD9BYI6_DISEL|nr:Solute carrier family 2 facilitated glucose transporter member 11 [Dissostichus eleginoides]